MKELMKNRDQRGRDIQQEIRQVLLRHWDPIGVQDIPEAQDEYDDYVGGVYRLLANGSADDVIANHLDLVERLTMGLAARDRSRLVSVVRRLRDIDLAPGRD
jgi:hypothetical protein